MNGPTRRKQLLSRGAWIFVGVCAIATPLLFGVWPTSWRRIIPFLMLSWMGAFIGGAAAVLLRSDDAAPAADAGKGDDKTAPPS